MTFGSRVKKLREETGMSQAQVAELIPMNQSNYSKIERDVQEPSLFQLKRISEIFGVSCDELLETGRENAEAVQETVFARKIIRLYREIFGEK